jgi:hypothetical protein
MGCKLSILRLPVALLLTASSTVIACKTRGFDSHSGAQTEAITAREISPWPSKTIPYDFDYDLPADVQKNIQEAIKTLNAHDVVNLVKAKPPSPSAPFVPVIIFASSRSQCKSLGFGYSPDNPIMVRISASCKKGNILHEILHVLGFLHEHSSPSQGAPKVLWAKIATGMEDQYDYLLNSDGAYHAQALTPYDAGSIMHYSSDSSTICDDPTDPKWNDPKLEGQLPNVLCKVEGWRKIRPSGLSALDCMQECASLLDSKTGKPVFGQREDLSAGDLKGLKALYPK